MITRRLALLGSVFAAGGLTASNAWSQAKPAPVNVRVVTPPITNYSALLVARDKGYFGEENLNVTWSFVTQSAVSVEAVYGGSVEFGGGGIMEPMIARGNGLDITLAVPVSKIRKEAPDNSGLVTRAEDNIKEAKDLVGKKISVGLLNGINHVHMIEWLQRRGVDHKTLQFVEIPFPQMMDALLQNRLDCVWAVEPFLTLMNKTGKVRVLASPYQDNIPNMDLTAFFAKESWLKANPDVAIRFKRALQKGTDYLNQASNEERAELVAKYTGAKVELIREVNLPQFSREFDPPTLKANLDLAVAQKLVKPIEIDSVIWKQP